MDATEALISKNNILTPPRDNDYHTDLNGPGMITSLHFVF